MGDFTELYQLLYSTREKRNLGQFYSSDAEFEDPLVHVSGIADIESQFNGLQLLFRNISPQIKMQREEQDRVVIDADVSFSVLGILTLVIVQQTVFHLGSDGKIIKHQDMWSLSHVIQGVLGRVYTLIRKVNGKATSIGVRMAARVLGL